jgi:imidazole glycerol-phosphate synthase subunit HisH
VKILLPRLAIGNFASVLRMVHKVGHSAQLVDRPDDLREADKIILAGVGAFDAGMAALIDGTWIDALNDAAFNRRVPVLGICLGMQLMCKSSEEGKLAGLGWIDGVVTQFRFPEESKLKVPHMGWNTVEVRRSNALIAQDSSEKRYYFVHSYYAQCRTPADVVATSHHGVDFVAALNRDNLYGVQFHPEKSHRFGMDVIRHFVEL